MGWEYYGREKSSVLIKATEEATIKAKIIPVPLSRQTVFCYILHDINDHKGPLDLHVSQLSKDVAIAVEDNEIKEKLKGNTSSQRIIAGQGEIDDHINPR
ncbi:unnamed protein product [Natator depressus]